MNFRDLNALVQRRQSEFKALEQTATANAYSDTSQFWRDILGGRPNFIAATDFNQFRDDHFLAITGIGGQPDIAEETALFDGARRECADAADIPDEVLATLAEPLLGSPSVQPYRGNLFSSKFLQEVAVAWTIRTHGGQCGLPQRPLRVCEIGAGFGTLALVLHEIFEIESYTVIDLPENLYLSSIFLPLSLPARTHQLVMPADIAGRIATAHLNFLTPEFTDLVPGPFDLVVNRASMGEMPVETATAYIKWIHQRLGPDGLFYFCNRYNVPNTEGATRFTDFGIQNFDIREIWPLPRLTRPMNQIHCEILAGKFNGGFTPDPDLLDTVADLIACGFNPQIETIRRAVLKSDIDPRLHAALKCLREFFLSPSIPEKIAILQRAVLVTVNNIRATLLTIIALIVGNDTAAAQLLPETLKMNLGIKLEVKMRGLDAEHQRARGEEWTSTLTPLQSLSEIQYRMCLRALENGRTPFSYRLKRDLRFPSD